MSLLDLWPRYTSTLYIYIDISKQPDRKEEKRERQAAQFYREKEWGLEKRICLLRICSM